MTEHMAWYTLQHLDICAIITRAQQ